MAPTHPHQKAYTYKVDLYAREKFTSHQGGSIPSKGIQSYGSLLPPQGASETPQYSPPVHIVGAYNLDQGNKLSTILS